MTDDKQYACKDTSILLPHFKKYMWVPWAPYIPERIAANSLTLTGSLMALLSLLITLQLAPTSRLLYLIPAALVFLYMTLDNMDGGHARRTGQSSPLGEFLDHWLDTLNGAFVGWAMAHALGLPPWMTIAVLACVLLAVFATYWEQKVTGIIHMGMFGNIEGLVLVTAAFIGIALAGQAAFTAPLVQGVSLGLAIMALYGLGSIGIAVGCFMRVHDERASWVPLLITLAVVPTWFYFGAPGYIASALILVATNALFSGRLLAARLLPQGHRVFEAVIPASLVIATGASLVLNLSAGVQAILAGVIAAGMGALVIYDFYRFVYGLRHHLRPTETLGRLFGR
jgi:phosphatidylglycerophosphate synthase